MAKPKIGENAMNFRLAEPSTLKSVSICIYGNDTDVADGNGSVGAIIPEWLHGWDIVKVAGGVHTIGGTAGTTSLNLVRRRAGSDTVVCSTAITVAYDEYYADNAIINTANAHLQKGDILIAICSGVPTGGLPKGAYVVVTIG